MADLHILVVVDSETGDMRLAAAGLDEAPTDSRHSVFDDPEWRRPTDAEVATVIDAERRLAELLDR